MEAFVHRQNLLFFRKQLAGKLSLSQRLQLLRLLAEEEAPTTCDRDGNESPIGAQRE